MSHAVPIILDTDIGNDIDDAVCLAYLLRKPACELVGITTVSGYDPRIRASLADAVCQAGGRTDVPIHSGAGCRIDTGAVVQGDIPQEAVLAHFAHRPPSAFAHSTAVSWLHEQITRRPGEITLLAIGPMTNIGLLFAMDPGIGRKLKSLVLMCGAFTNHVTGIPPREWNALCDPLAAHIVYRTDVTEHRSVGLDVTLQVQMPAEQCISRFAAIGGPLAVVSAMTRIWGTQNRAVTFHDPLAAACIFAPRILTFAEGTVTVERDSERLSGLTHWDAASQVKPHRVAVNVDAPAFFSEYFMTVSGQERTASG